MHRSRCCANRDAAVFCTQMGHSAVALHAPYARPYTSTFDADASAAGVEEDGAGGGGEPDASIGVRPGTTTGFVAPEDAAACRACASAAARKRARTRSGGGTRVSALSTFSRPTVRARCASTATSAMTASTTRAYVAIVAPTTLPGSSAPRFSRRTARSSAASRARSDASASVLRAASTPEATPGPPDIGTATAGSGAEGREADATTEGGGVGLTQQLDGLRQAAGARQRASVLAHHHIVNVRRAGT